MTKARTLSEEEIKKAAEDVAADEAAEAKRQDEIRIEEERLQKERDDAEAAALEEKAITEDKEKAAAEADEKEEELETLDELEDKIKYRYLDNTPFGVKLSIVERHFKGATDTITPDHGPAWEAYMTWVGEGGTPLQPGHKW